MLIILRITGPKEWSEILNPNCTGLAGPSHRKTLRFLIRIQNKISSKELAGKTSELAGRVLEMMQSGGNLSPDEGFMGAVLVMGEVAMVWIPALPKQGFF